MQKYTTVVEVLTEVAIKDRNSLLGCSTVREYSVEVAERDPLM